MICPHCVHCQTMASKGGLSLISDLSGHTDQERETPKTPVRGKARDYSQAFEIAWKAYPRKEQKFEAFAIWSLRAKEVGGDSNLATLVLGSLKWQIRVWANDEFKFAPYFERYLKRRKWEDEQPQSRQAVPRYVDDRLSQGTDRKLAELRAAADRRATPEELAQLRGVK